MEEEVSEKPLHVQVAEAFGCTPVLNGETWECGDYGHSYSSYVNEDGEEYNDYIIPRFDTDWAVTGPLIEKRMITLTPTPMGWSAGTWPGSYEYQTPDGAGPLIAVCNLILVLKAAQDVRAALDARKP